MTLADLRRILSDSSFHHATYRNQGTLWEGLWIYIKHETGFRGYSVYGMFPKDSPDLQTAEDLVHGPRY